MADPTDRKTDIQRCIEQLEQTAEDLLSDTQKRVAGIRDLADQLARREHLRADVERSGPTEFEPGGIFGGV